MVTADYKLFTPLTIGKDLVLKNRVVMGPMTRARSDPVTREATELNATYYEQRAGAGLIISEATAVSEQGHGWYGTPALYTSGQAAAWKNVVDRVHLKGGKIFAQLWHMGRVAHPSFNSKNEVVSASAIRLEDGHLRNVKGEHVPYETPRALLTEEIPDVVEDYCRSAQFAKDAGFDGMNFTLQTDISLISSCSPPPTSGRITVKTVWPADRIGVRLSPNGGFSGMGNADNPEQFTYVLTMLGEYGLAYVALLDGVGFGYHDKARLLTVFDAKLAFKGLVLANNSYTRDIAEGAVRSGTADFVSFGRPFISNPDLAERFANDWPLNPDASYEAY
uniref:NADH:flavin oxidoreductase/NADH oxidase N-terminal domain-containing protein n=1 Tax=Globisporangium ultimum (strain ATCC 200006 / CBS 805.95 / DAOM BR144) TaxID=431595 RepID=K3XCE7_GLOUD